MKKKLKQAHEKVKSSGKSKPQWGSNSHLSELLSSKRTQITNVGEDVEKREPLYTLDGNVIWCSYYGKEYGEFSKKLKVELPYDLAILLLGIYAKINTLIQKEIR